MQDIKNKTIFIASLDWGLGHATRCVPIIRALSENNNKIILGVTPLTNTIFEEEFPELKKVEVPAYKVKYSNFLSISIKLILDSLRIFRVIKEENKLLQDIITEHKIDIVISDNRFGLYSEKTRNIFITHQVFVKSAAGNFIAQKINRSYILKFDEVWVPDYASKEESLSDELSHGKQFHNNIKFIGPQSRLLQCETSVKRYDYLYLISGPEPQSTIFKKLLIEKSKRCPHLNFALISGSKSSDVGKNLTCFLSPNAETISKIVSESKIVICRSGYSTLMDMHVLKKKQLMLVATPGQTEQEYLARLWCEKFGSTLIIQKKLGAFSL